MNFVRQSILSNNKLSDGDLLILAKFAIYFSTANYCRQMINITKQLFTTCITTAVHEDNDTAITLYVQELYSSYEEDCLLKITVDLFLPLEGQLMKKMYTCLTFKLL